MCASLPPCTISPGNARRRMRSPPLPRIAASMDRPAPFHHEPHKAAFAARGNFSHPAGRKTDAVTTGMARIAKCRTHLKKTNRNARFQIRVRSTPHKAAFAARGNFSHPAGRKTDAVTTGMARIAKYRTRLKKTNRNARFLIRVRSAPHKAAFAARGSFSPPRWSKDGCRHDRRARIAKCRTRLKKKRIAMRAF